VQLPKPYLINTLYRELTDVLFFLSLSLNLLLQAAGCTLFFNLSCSLPAAHCLLLTVLPTCEVL